MAEHLDKGRKGEEIALAYLRENGYSILEKNWRHKHLEIDIIAKKNNILHFVEVKTRKLEGMLLAHESLSYKKTQNLLRAIEIYLSQMDDDCTAQLDLIAININKLGEISLEHFENCTA